MASLARPTLLPQCASCMRRAVQQVRSKSKAAREAERNIVVKLRRDVPRFGRAGSYIPIAPAMMRNQWFPFRIADYVTPPQLKQLKAEGVTMARDVEFGVRRTFIEEEEGGEEEVMQQRAPYVRPIEIDMLTPERSMQLLTTFVPATIDFTRQPIPHEKVETAQPRHGASDAADVLTAAAMAKKSQVESTGIYGSVSTADVAATIKLALAHNDEAARVLLSESDIRFVEGHTEGDSTRVKQLGSFKVEIQAQGAAAPITRTVRIRAKE
ncbi:uncharacterized protein BDR25DRAFT_257691 [Lindgomyces ingoldianus]|uniref:Uncharacterized protein n=1 Tax=Lindgomyces ingoldianus TaxID=673940 RepID=A0ACB6R239_9PLEO|nr:uncharacterized protein BDR25DRAFT_257691 [Lindgomyces ingoldianus]KAF2473323.1 hypothetical protein BDR25DRAFT_257691 [Lindgomyces ingoldianus]